MLWFILFCVVIAYLVLVPIATIVWGSFRTAPPGVEGPLTTANYERALWSPSFWGSMGNTIVFGISSTIIAFCFGCYLAWVTERTNAPLRRVIYTLVLIPLIIPGILSTIAWSLVLNDRIGIANAMLSGLLGTDVAFFDGYTMGGMIWADATDSITLPFLLMAAAFRAMDPSLEEASTTSGAPPGYTFRHVTLPLMTPAVLATMLIVFVKTVENFDVPLVLGLPGGVTVLATEVFIATRRFPADTNLAAAYAVLYLVLTVVLLVVYFRATRISEKFTTITGKGYRPQRIDLRGKRHLHAAIAAVVLVVSVIIPFLVVLYTSLLPFYTPPTRAAFGNFSLDNYRYVFENPIVRRAVTNNIVVGVSASLVAIVIAALISWIVIRTKLPGRRLLDVTAFAPLAFPGLVIGLALMWLYLTLPIPIYATLWILGLGYVTAYTPYALRASHASLTQLNVELEEASAVSGARWLRTFFRVVLPVISGGLLVGFLYVLTRTFKVLSLPILLAGPGTEVLPVLIYDLYDGSRYTELNALGILLFLFLLGLSLVAQLVQRSVSYAHLDS